MQVNTQQWRMRLKDTFLQRDHQEQSQYNFEYFGRLVSEQKIFAKKKNMHYHVVTLHSTNITSFKHEYRRSSHFMNIDAQAIS